MVRKHVWQEEPARKGRVPPVVQCAYAISSEPLLLSRDIFHCNGACIRIRHAEILLGCIHGRVARKHVRACLAFHVPLSLDSNDAARCMAVQAGYVRAVKDIAYFADFARKSTALARKSSLPEAHISDRFCHIGKKYYLCSPCNIGKSQQN